MKAIVSSSYGPAESMQVKEVANPVPSENELLVRNRASVVTAAMCEARAGSPMARLYFGLRKPKWPILGTNFSGEVQAVGSSVTNFRVGDLVAGVSVTNFGAYAEYIVVSEDGVVAPKPSNLSDEEAVAVFDGSITALPFLRDAAKLLPGQSVLINGASGAVGTAAIQLAKHYGATVTAVCSGANQALVASLGADHVVDYAIEDFTDNHDSYDVIFDAVARSSFLRSRRALKQGGMYLTTGPSLAILLQMLWTSKMGRKKAAVVFTGLAKPAQMWRNLVFIGELAEAGSFLPVIGSTQSMEDGAHAHRQVETGHKRGSAVITIAAESVRAIEREETL